MKSVILEKKKATILDEVPIGEAFKRGTLICIRCNPGALTPLPVTAYKADTDAVVMVLEDTILVKGQVSDTPCGTLLVLKKNIAVTPLIPAKDVEFYEK